VHEPDVQCISKGKEHKTYEFGCKVSLAVTKTSGICVGAMSFEKNPYDGHTLKEALAQCERLAGLRPKTALVDLGYRGAQKVGDTEILYAGRISKEVSGSKRYRLKRKLHRRASIEPRIGHLKARFRMGRKFLKGIFGGMANALLAASAMNLVSWMSRLYALILYWIQRSKGLGSARVYQALRIQGTF
jgi:IS5 family transposase